MPTLQQPWVQSHSGIWKAAIPLLQLHSADTHSDPDTDDRGFFFLDDWAVSMFTSLFDDIPPLKDHRKTVKLRWKIHKNENFLFWILYNLNASYAEILRCRREALPTPAHPPAREKGGLDEMDEIQRSSQLVRSSDCRCLYVATAMGSIPQWNMKDCNHSVSASFSWYSFRPRHWW
jgi:hypothetical protein